MTEKNAQLTRALPREAMWFFVVAPPLLAFLFDPDCVKEPGSMARALAAVGLYTIVTGLAVHLSFEWLARRLAEQPVLVRVPAHALFASVVVVAVSLPQLPLVRWLYPEAQGDELSVVWRGVLVSLGYLALASFIASLQRRAIRAHLEAHAEQTAALESRLAMLQAQMQPHFLFNALNVCAGLVHEDPDAAEQTLDRLAGFLRYALESTEHRFVTLGEELETVERYLLVQAARFGDRLAFELEADDEARARRVPPMLVQPLVENAVMHGLADREEGGRVRVTARVIDGDLEIAVEDDGVGPEGSSIEGTGIGLKNVRERLTLAFGHGAELSSGRSEALGGFSCAMRIPSELRA